MFDADRRWSRWIHQPISISGHAFGVFGTRVMLSVTQGCATRELRSAGAPPWAIIGPSRWDYDFPRGYAFPVIDVDPRITRLNSESAPIPKAPSDVRPGVTPRLRPSANGTAR